MLEIGGEEIHLVSDGPDRYVAETEPFEAIIVQRSADGQVAGISFERPGQPGQTGVRVESHRETLITFRNGDVELAGSLLMPAGSGPHPAVAIVHGTEFGTRETYRLLASHFARRGVAALIYDKRGTGKSTGHFASATFDDLTITSLQADAAERATTVPAGRASSALGWPSRRIPRLPGTEPWFRSSRS